MAMYIYDQKQLTKWLKIANDLIFEYMKKGDTITRTVDCKNVKTNDLIDREDALDIFIEGDGDDDFTTGYNWAVDEYREKISKLPSVNNWIPCKDKLPKEGKNVNVTWRNKNMPKYQEPFVGTAILLDGIWYWYPLSSKFMVDIDGDIEILAWMPMPKPFKGF